MKNLWMRLGNPGNYESFETIEQAADMLSSCGEKGDYVKVNQYGISGGHFTGENYISIFWGDNDAQPIEAIDVQAFSGLVKKIFNESYSHIYK